MDQKLKVILLALIMISFPCIYSNGPFELVDNTIIPSQSSESTNNSTTGNNTEMDDPCSQIRNNETPWVCVYPEDWRLEYPLGTMTIPFILEAGNMPGDSVRYVNINAQFTGDTDWCFPVYDANNSPVLDGSCAGWGISYGLEENESDFEKDSTELPMEDFEEGCYFLSITEISLHDSEGQVMDGWGNSFTNLTSLTPENSSFKLGDVDCFSTDYSKKNGWNQTSISEHEEGDMFDDVDQDVEGGYVSGFTLIGTLFITCIVAIIRRQRVPAIHPSNQIE